MPDIHLYLTLRLGGLPHYVASPTMRLSTTDGSAFAWLSSHSLVEYLGKRLTVEDSAGKQATGYILEADAAEAFGSELVTNGDMELDANWVNQNTPTLNERSSEQAHGGTYSRKFTANSEYDGIRNLDTPALTAGKSYKKVDWIYGDGTNKNCIRVVEEDGTDPHYPSGGGLAGILYAASWTEVITYFTSITTIVHHVQSFSGTGVTVGTWYLDDVSMKEVTDVGTDGVHIVSALGGATRNWTSIDSGFDPNDVASVTVH